MLIFLRENNIDVLFSQGLLRCTTGTEQPFSVPVSRIAASCKAVLADDVVFDKQSAEVLVWAELVNNSRHKVFSTPSALFEPDSEILTRTGILPARCLVDGRTGLVPIRLLNVTGATRLYKGKTLGTVEEHSQPMSAITPGHTVETSELDIDKFDWSKCELNSDQQQKLSRLLRTYSDVFSTGPDDLGRTNVTRHTIPTRDSRPTRQRQYRQPYHLRQEMNRQIDGMLANNIIKESCSPWSSPVLMVPKKDGTFRFCVDFRGLNEMTVKDPFPLPRIDETLDSLGGARHFSTLDLASGYWQVELDDKDKQRTGFTTPRGHYEFEVMPFGLCNAPATFQRLMDSVLRGLAWVDLPGRYNHLLHKFRRTPGASEGCI